MSQFDHLDIDGHLLKLLAAVVDELSITRAAARLGVTQSAVSHQLDKLRGIVGDPLFVKSGRGIVPTAHALALAVRARVLLDELHDFSSASVFNPAKVVATVTVAANELQRDLLLPRFLRAVRDQAPGLTLCIVPSGVPTPDMLRDQVCQMAITPRPPDARDILQKRLFEDEYRVFYDKRQREAPLALDDYLDAEHATVQYDPPRPLDIDEVLAARGLKRKFVVKVPGFAGLSPFLLGSRLIATAPSLLQTHILRGLANAPVPVECPPMPMYLVWHMRHQSDPMHRWLREQLEKIVAASLASAGVVGKAGNRSQTVQAAASCCSS